MVTKPPPEVLTTEKLSFMSTLSEYQRRRFLATEALALADVAWTKFVNLLEPAKILCITASRKSNPSTLPIVDASAVLEAAVLNRFFFF